MPEQPAPLFKLTAGKHVRLDVVQSICVFPPRRIGDAKLQATLVVTLADRSCIEAHFMVEDQAIALADHLAERIEDWRNGS